MVLPVLVVGRVAKAGWRGQVSSLEISTIMELVGLVEMEAMGWGRASLFGQAWSCS